MVKKAAVFLLLILSFTLLNVITHSVIGIENSWETMSDVPTGRLEPGVAAVNGKIYVIGGYNQSPLNTNQEYNPATDTWVSKKNMPTRRSNFAVAVYQDKIFCIGGGGEFGSEEVTGLTEVYDPVTDTWETKALMPTPRQFMQANVVDGKIYVIGGSKPVSFNNISYVPSVNEVYDPETNSWGTSKAPPVHVSNYASAVCDDKIYLFSDSLTQIFDPRTGSWSSGTPMPNPGKDASAGVTTGTLAPKRIYVIGGYPSFNLNQIYNPETDSWTKGATMPTNRYGLGVAVVNDVIYAIGGSGAEGGAANERLMPTGYIQPIQTSELPTKEKIDNSSPSTQDNTFPIMATSVAICIVAIVSATLYLKKKRE